MSHHVLLVLNRFPKEEGRLHQGEPQVQRVLQDFFLRERSSRARSDAPRPRQTLHVSDMWRAIPLSAHPHWAQGASPHCYCWLAIVFVCFLSLFISNFVFFFNFCFLKNKTTCMRQFVLVSACFCKDSTILRLKLAKIAWSLSCY